MTGQWNPWRSSEDDKPTTALALIVQFVVASIALGLAWHYLKGGHERGDPLWSTMIYSAVVSGICVIGRAIYER